MIEVTRRYLPPMPARIGRLPQDHRGFPIPWFVATLADGTRDFRVADMGKFAAAVKAGACWVCGEPTGRNLAFVLGPMCTVTRTTAEPGCHLECAVWSARACPFLTRPRMRRNEHEMPPDRVEAAGHGIMRNPGVAAIWVCREFSTFRPLAGAPGTLIQVGAPSTVLWFCEGRMATREEVEESITSGLPQLEAMARKEGPDALKALHTYLADARKFLPPPMVAVPA